jgi:hypothetical protein
MIIGMGTNERGEVIGRFQVTMDLNGWDVADLLAGQLANYEPESRPDDARFIAALNRESIVALIEKALAWGGAEEGGLIGNEPENWYGAYGAGPSRMAVSLISHHLPEFNDKALDNYLNHVNTVAGEEG